MTYVVYAPDRHSTARGSMADRVLLVGDAPEAREAVALACRARGFCTLQAATPADACRLAAELAPSVVVIDLELSPPEDAVALVRELRQDMGLNRLPAVILIATPITGPRETFIRANCTLLVLKPCDPEELTGIVASLVVSP
jgi:CheY-like chemotaxis protein